MDKTRKEELSVTKICRLCLTDKDPLLHIFNFDEECSDQSNKLPLSLQIMSCISIEVVRSSMPPYICIKCKFFVEQSYSFKQLCLKADQILYSFINSGQQFKAMEWPENLNKVAMFIDYKHTSTEDIEKTNKEPEQKPKTKTKELLQCDYCTKKYKTKEALITHITTHPSPMHTCKLCNMNFVTALRLSMHVKKYHTVKLNCTECGHFSKTPALFEKHKKTHQEYNSRPLECNYCDMRFPKKLTLLKHLEYSHNEIKPFKCEYCSDAFGMCDDLKNHLLSKHNCVRSFACQYCEKIFLRQIQMARHRRVMHRVVTHLGRGRSYMCDQCSTTFKTQREMLYHYAFHTSQTLTCPLCKCHFKSISSINEHLKHHADNKQYMCDVCDLMFLEKEKLDEHITRDHPDYVSTTDRTQASTDEEHDLVQTNKETPVKKQGQFKLFLDLPNITDATDKSQSPSRVKTFPESNKVEDNTRGVSQDYTPSLPVIELNDDKIDLTCSSKQTAVESDTTPTILRKAEAVKKKLASQLEKNKKKLSDEGKTETVQIKHLQTPGKQKANKSVSEKSIKPVVKPNEKSLKLLEKELDELKQARKNNSEETKTEEKSSVKTSGPVRKVKPAPVTLKAVEKTNKPSTNAAPNKPDKTADPRDEKVTVNVDEVNTARSRPTRGVKRRNYARMAREDLSDDETSSSDEEPTPKRKQRAALKKQQVTGNTATTPKPAKKRGRKPKQVQESTEESPPESADTTLANKSLDVSAESTSNANATGESNSDDQPVSNSNETVNKQESTPKKLISKPDVIITPEGQKLTKVNPSVIKSLPPGVKPIPLTSIKRSSEICEMMIGQKTVKVQKIVMTKAEVDAMAKQGLVEMKGGTLVLKQRVKIKQTPAQTKTLDQKTDTPAKSNETDKKPTRFPDQLQETTADDKLNLP